MVRPSIRLAFAALPLALGYGCRAATHGLEDSIALIQGPNSGKSGKSTGEEDADKADWPSLGDLFDEVKGSAEGITSEVGEVTDAANSQADQVVSGVSNITTNLAAKVAGALNRALGYVKTEADILFNETLTEKAKLLAMANQSLADTGKSMLASFESVVHEAIVKAHSRWKRLRRIVDQSADVLKDALSSAGQGKIAKQFGGTVDDGEEYLDSFMLKLQLTDEDLHGIGQKKLAEAEAILLRSNERLNEALQQVVSFVATYQLAFQDIIDTISNAILRSNEDVDRAFSSVQHNLTAITWRVRSSCREFLLGIHHTVVAVTKAENMTAPGWHPVSVPVLNSRAPAATGLGLLATAVALLALAV